MSRFLPRIGSIFHSVSHEETISPSPTPFHSATGCEKQSDGSIKVSMKLDKDKVECCVCLSPMSGHIYRCQGSLPRESAENKKPITHNICGSCEWQMRRMKERHGRVKPMKCPICKVQGPFTRNRSLERQLTKLSKPCCHSKDGCSVRFFPWDEQREVHENFLCIHQPADCPFCHQSIPGGRSNFVEHLVKSIVSQNDLSPSPANPEEIEPVDLPHDGNLDSADAVRSIDLDLDSDFDDHDEEMSNGPIPRLQLDHFLEQQHQQIIQEVEERKANESTNESTNTSTNMSSDKRDDRIHQVPGCTIPFHQCRNPRNSPDDKRYILSRDRNEFVADFDLGIAFCFIAPTAECACWKVYALSISPRHGSCGNSKVYIQHCNHYEREQYLERQEMAGLGACYMMPPVENTLVLELGRLHPTALRQRFNSYPPQNEMAEISRNQIAQKPALKSRETIALNNSEMKENEESIDNHHNKMEMEMDTDFNEAELEEYAPLQFMGKSPCSQIQCGFIYAGNPKFGPTEVVHRLSVRIFTLEQSLQVGSVVDARDHSGNWCLAEVKLVRDEEGNEFVNLNDLEEDDYLEIRQAKLHWLGYPSIYDEWIDIDTDSHRIAQRGTFTIGPDLRALRKHDMQLRALAHRNVNVGDRVIPRSNRN